MTTILVTGANGEIGHGLINGLYESKLYENSETKIVALDLADLDPNLKQKVTEFVQGDILDNNLIESLFEKYKFDKVFHLAALLSTSSEKDPVRAHHVNTDGAINILFHSERFARVNKHKLVFMFPSTIAIYGLPDVETSKSVGKIKESQWNKPATMYGCNKLYIELLGNYYSRYYQKDYDTNEAYLDFRCVRFPGIISADTLPTGGTSDFGPEILHAAAQGKDYQCFVRADTALPFMVMPDAVKAIVELSNTDKKLNQDVYNVGSFTITAEEIAEIAKNNFNWEKVSYVPDQKRQAIVDSWPTDVDDSNARTDWGWKPDFDLEKSFSDYLIPAIRERYSL